MPNIKNKIGKIFATCILGLMFVLMVTSSLGDSATFDEVAHIPAGYSYLTLHDYRINPEHPPLVKMLSAIPLLFLNLNFPTDVPAWQEINPQWDMGRIFLYESGNDADQILRFTRFPIMLLALLLGWLLFKWASVNYGNKVGLLTLFFYAFSPTIIAHSRYVTTDIGAAIGFLIGIATFVRFLENPTHKNIVIAGLAFGIAQTIKFSCAILMPVYLFIIITWALLHKNDDIEHSGFWKIFWPIVGKTFLIGLVSVAVIWLVYLIPTWNYPIEHQVLSAQTLIGHFAWTPFVKLSIWMSGIPFLQAMGHYLFGLLMMMQRADGGNTAFFLGTVSSQGTPLYFPLLYAVKESLVFHIFTLIAIFFSVSNLLKRKACPPQLEPNQGNLNIDTNKQKTLKSFWLSLRQIGDCGLDWMRGNFTQVASIIFVAFYLLLSVTGNLNIGIRHILPILPFIYFLVARQIIRWINANGIDYPENIAQWIKYLYLSFVRPAWKYALTFCLLFIMLAVTVLSSPYYLSYYNLLGGSTANGYKIATDSNYDWGQDFKRLEKFIEKNNIEKMKIDYFGGANPSYYLGDNWEPWWSSKGAPEAGSWLAVSVNTFTGNQATPKGDFIRKPEDNHSWLLGKEPIARAGSSIFIYKF